MKKIFSIMLAFVLCAVCFVGCVSDDTDDSATHKHTPKSAVKENIVAATCTSEGSYNEVVYCADCGGKISTTKKIVEKLAHSYVDGVCSCGAVDPDYDPCVHTPAAAVRENVVDATCTTAGSYEEVVKCALCGEEISRTAKVIEKLDHTPGEATRENVVEATCTIAGSYVEVIKCSLCGVELSREDKIIEKAAHTPTDVIKENAVAATCTSEGSYEAVIKCSDCGEELSRVLKAEIRLDHKFSRGSCTYCGAADPFYVPIHSHNFVDGICDGCGLTNPKFDYGDATVFIPGDDLQIVYDDNYSVNGDASRILAEKLQYMLGENSKIDIVNMYANNTSREIVVGLLDETRPATVTAYKLLEKYERDSYFTPRYVIYADSNTIAIAYDIVECSAIQPIEYIMEKFIKNYINGAEYIAFGRGVITNGSIDLLSIQKELDVNTLNEQWKNFEAVAGKEIADAVRTLYSLYTDDIIDWFANLYDPGIGAFYAASSGRDGKAFGPDIENGVQILSFIQNSGMIDEILNGDKLNWANLLPAEMVTEMIYFAKNLQDKNGYFYHPQWDRGTIDSNIIRRSRDLGRSTNILTSLGSAPTYDTPTGTKGDGITADEYWAMYGIGEKPYTYDKSPRYGETQTPNLGTSASEMVSRVVLTSDDDSSNTAYLKSHTAFIDYVLDNVIPGVKSNPYSGGSEIGESQSQVNYADKQLGPYVYQESDGERYAEYDGMTLRQILVYEMNKIINPETGFWGDVLAGDEGIEFRYTNGFMKSMAMYNGLGMPYPEEYAAIAATNLMKGLLSDEPSENNICEVYNVWVSITRLNDNLKYIDNLEVRDEVERIVSEALDENAAAAIINSYNKIKGYKKYDGGFSHYYTKGTASHSNMPVATGENQSDVDATCIGVTGLAQQIRIALGYSNIMPDLYTASDWMRFYQTLLELTPVIKHEKMDETVKPPVYTFEDDETSNLIVSGTNEIVKEGEDSKLKITKSSTSSGASVKLDANVTNPLANVTVFQADVKYANITGLSETQITFATKGLDSLGYSPILILLTFAGKDDGSKIYYTDYHNGKGNGQKIDTGAVIGEWFNIRVEYYNDGADVAYHYKTYINDKLIYVSDYIYSTNIVSGVKSLPTANNITRATYAMNMRFLGDFYFDNVSLTQKYDENAKNDPDYTGKPVAPGGPTGPSIDVNLPPETEFGPLMEFDGMPAADRIATSCTNPQNAHTIISAESGNKVLHISKPGSPSDYSSSYNFTVKTTAKEENATVAVFTADILLKNLTSISDIQITAKTTETAGSGASPFIIFLTPKGKDNGTALKYNEFGPAGVNNSINKDLEAKVGKWFRLRVEYRVTATNTAGEPTAIEYKTYINDSLVYTSTSIYGKDLSVNGGSIPLPTADSIFGISFSFNSKLCGDIYIDNVGFIKCAGDFVMPEAETEVGTNSSLEADEPEAPEHTHKFVDGKCECGESDPNYTPDTPNPDTPDTPAEPESILTFDKMPAALTINTTYAENSCGIETLESGNSVLVVDKKCDGSYSCSFNMTVAPTEKTEGAKKAVFVADVCLDELSGISEIQITGRYPGGAGNADTPFFVLFKPSATTAGAAINYTMSEGGTVNSGAVVGEWFRIRLEYSITGYDGEGTPISIEVGIYVNDILLETSNKIYGTNLAVNGGSKILPKADELTGITLSFNSKLVGKCYVDNMGLFICDEFVMPEVDSEYAPHTHTFVDGECECGETDPNYVAPHEHKFVDGKCECGATDPEYVPFDGIVDFDEDYSSYISFTTADAHKENNTVQVVDIDGNKVLFVDKAGKDSTFSGGATLKINPTIVEDDATVMVFEFDLMLENITGYDTQILLYHKGGATAKKSPFLISLPRIENSWARITITYEVTATDENGVPSAIEYSVYVDNELQSTKTDIYGADITSGAVAIPAISDITNIAIGLNNSFLGDAYFDNVSLNLLQSFKIEAPVECEHDFVEGVCDKCGETDPSYVAPHEHKFVDGKCECGATDPEYVPFDGIVDFNEDYSSYISFTTADAHKENNTVQVVDIDGNKVLFVDKAGKDSTFSGGATLKINPTIVEDDATVMVFEFDLMLENITGYDTQILLYHKGGATAKKSPFLISLPRIENSWARITITYEVTATDENGVPSAIEYSVYVDNELQSTKTDIYGADITSGAVAIPAISDITNIAIGLNNSFLGDAYFDNVSLSLLQSFKIEAPEVDSLIKFDQMPASTDLSITSPGITSEGIVGTNTWEISTVGEEKVLYINKGATGLNADGTLLNYGCGVSLSVPVKIVADNANVLIFEADVMFLTVTAIDDLQLTVNNVNKSPFVGLLRPLGTENGASIRNGSTGATQTITSAKVGEWFHIRLEYWVTEEDETGKPVSYEVKYFVNDDAPVVTTAVRSGTSIFALSELTSVTMSFNRSNLGEYYVDNVDCRLDYAEPHTHNYAEAIREKEIHATCTANGSYDSVVYCSDCKAELSRTAMVEEKLDHAYVDGVCIFCGASDPDYVAPDNGDEPTECVHSYVVGVCAFCGASDPDYVAPDNGDEPTECVHSYVDGVCTFCGASDPDYVAPDNGDEPTECVHSYVDGVCTFCGASDPDYVAPDNSDEPDAT